MLFENRPARCCSSRPTPTLYFDVCLPNHLTPSYCLGHCCTWYSGIGHWGTVGSRRYGSRSYADLRVRMVFTYEPGTSIYLRQILKKCFGEAAYLVSTYPRLRLRTRNYGNTRDGSASSPGAGGGGLTSSPGSSFFSVEFLVIYGGVFIHEQMNDYFFSHVRLTLLRVIAGAAVTTVPA